MLPAPFAELETVLRKTLPMANIRVANPPQLPQLKLGLINADFPTGPLPGEVMHAVIARPAYWAFCWGSGLAAAQWITGNPAIVAGKRVADLGSGSGVVGIAAAQAGAAQVWACDNDPDALRATRCNALANNVQLNLCDDLCKLPRFFDLLFMADVLYDASNFALIAAAKSHTRKIIIADSRVARVDDPDFCLSHTQEALTFPNLGEFDEFRNVHFFVSGET